MKLLTTTRLSCYFGGLKAVDQVDFAIDQGEIRAIIGPNGAGKSTFVSMLCGRQEPTSGRIDFAGQDITRVPAHKRTSMGIAYTFQITSVFKQLTCLQNVELATQSKLLRSRRSKSLPLSAENPPDYQPDKSLKKSLNQSLTKEALLSLTQVGLEKHASMKAANLSYGHQRLLEIAMGLALAPRLLMLDEPTQGLADKEIENFINLIREVAQDATILLIEHNMDVVMQLAHSITVFNEGKILANGTPDHIKHNEQVQQAYLGG